MNNFDQEELQAQHEMAMDYAAELAQDNRWITVKPHGPDKKGRPVEIDEWPDVIALDKSSVRSIDADGRMHIAISNISKANVCNI